MGKITKFSYSASTEEIFWVILAAQDELLTKVNSVFRLGKKLYFCTPKIINC